MISAEQLSVFEEWGAATIDTPLTTKEIAGGRGRHRRTPAF